MSRFIDDLRAHAQFAAPWFIAPGLLKEWAAHSAKVWTMLRDPGVPVFLIGDVASYFYESDQERWDVEQDFPNVTPPLPEFWMEHRMPARIRSIEKGVTDVTKWIRHGRMGWFS
jgi:hypothetical protein